MSLRRLKRGRVTPKLPDNYKGRIHCYPLLYIENIEKELG